MFNFASIVVLLSSSLLCHHSLANESDDHNCTNTSSCVHIRRAWPKLDFDFYHGNGDKVEYSIEPTTPTTTSTTITTTITSIEATPSSLRNDTTLSPPPMPTTNCSDSDQQLYLENYLLRTVLNTSDANGTLAAATPANMTLAQLKTFFQEKLQQIYQLGASRLAEHLKSKQQRSRRETTLDDIEVVVKDVVTHNTSQLVNVLYYLRKNNLLVPYHDAEKIISFVDRKQFGRMIEFEVIEPVQPYNLQLKSNSGAYKVLWGSLNLTSWILLSLVILLILVSLALLVYICYRHRNVRRIWLENVTARAAERTICAGRWNKGNDIEQDEEDGSTPPPAQANKSTSTTPTFTMPKRKHQGIQFDSEALISPPSTGDSSGRERLIPIQFNVADLDRVSYLRTLERIQEIRKRPPNVSMLTEVQMGDETQSIVKEIRRELNRYNFKKIIREGDGMDGNTSTTSDA